MLVLFLHGCESLFQMGCICHGVVCLSHSFVDVRSCLKTHVMMISLHIIVGNAILCMVHIASTIVIQIVCYFSFSFVGCHTVTM